MIVINVKERKERQNPNFEFQKKKKKKKNYDCYVSSETLKTINSFAQKITFANVNMTFFKRII